MSNSDKDYETYLLSQALKVENGKPSRMLHKELVKHCGRQAGLPLPMRYPNLPIITSIIISITATVISLVQLLK